MSRTRNIANDLFFASAEEFLREGRSVEMRVKGFSMRPFVRNGRDDVVLSPIAGVEVRRGMVVLFRYRGRHVLHRVRKVEDGKLSIEGDGNYRITERAACEDVVAWVSEVRLGGRQRGFAYGSCRWRVRSAISLTIKLLRTLAVDVKRKIFG